MRRKILAEHDDRTKGEVESDSTKRPMGRILEGF